MLTTLYVRDLAVVAEAEIELGPGMTVVTGETGAGKSLLVDALLLLTGVRDDADLVRAGAPRAEVSAEFALDEHSAARRWLQEHDLDDGPACRIRRVLVAGGGSRAWINGRPAALAQLEALGAHLLEIHGQHEHQALLHRDHQLALLDAFGNHARPVEQVRKLARRMRELEADARVLGEDGAREPRLDMLAHECAELERWALPPARYMELEAEQRRLGHAERLIGGATTLAEMIEGDDGLRIRLARAVSELAKLGELDTELLAWREMLGSALIQVEEVGRSLSRYAQARDLDPGRLAEVDAHLQHLHDLARKHRTSAEALVTTLERLRDEHDALASAGAKIDALALERRALLAEYSSCAAQLTEARQAAARLLSTQVSALMDQLGMTGGRLEVALEPLPDEGIDANGRERCDFLISTNPGQPPKPLRRIASGGELARISLALEVALLGLDEVGCMVFDEVDSGIGGGVAETVGRKLRALGQVRQVLCVTHLPQVAAQGHAHLKVSKQSDDRGTRTQIEPLDTEGRREELARMLGGLSITRETRAHARTMLERAQTRD